MLVMVVVVLLLINSTIKYQNLKVFGACAYWQLDQNALMHMAVGMQSR